MSVHRRRLALRAMGVICLLPNCGGVLGIDEKHYVAADAGSEDLDGGSVSAEGAPAVTAPEGGSCACPVCQVCDAPGGCVPAPAGRACSLPHATGSCDGLGGCELVGCSPGYLDCTSDPGCETARSLTQCASCGSPCVPAHVVHAICDLDGTCHYDGCAPFSPGPGTYLDCDGVTANGCEAPPNATTSCGGCGVTCPNQCRKMAMTYQCKSD